jgi:hypothetical protein
MTSSRSIVTSSIHYPYYEKLYLPNKDTRRKEMKIETTIDAHHEEEGDDLVSFYNDNDDTLTLLSDWITGENNCSTIQQSIESVVCGGEPYLHCSNEDNDKSNYCYNHTGEIYSLLAPVENISIPHTNYKLVQGLTKSHNMNRNTHKNSHKNNYGMSCSYNGSRHMIWKTKKKKCIDSFIHCRRRASSF